MSNAFTPSLPLLAQGILAWDLGRLLIVAVVQGALAVVWTRPREVR